MSVVPHIVVLHVVVLLNMLVVLHIVVVQTLRVAFNEHVPPPKQQTTPPFSKPKFFAARNRVGPVTFSLLLAANLPKNLLC